MHDDIINNLTHVIDECREYTGIEIVDILENCECENNGILFFIYLIHNGYKQKIGISKDYAESHTYDELCCGIKDLIIKSAEKLKELS